MRCSTCRWSAVSLDLYAAALLFIAASLGLGPFVSTLAQTQFQAFQLAFVTMLPSILLSGFMFPFEGMPEVAQWIAEVLPLTHFNVIIRGVMLRGADLPELWPQVAKLAAVHRRHAAHRRGALQEAAGLSPMTMTRSVSALILLGMQATHRLREFAWPQGKTAAIVLTYDDALPSQLDVAIPQLDAVRLKGTFFLDGDITAAEMLRWRAVQRAVTSSATIRCFIPARAR